MISFMFLNKYMPSEQSKPIDEVLELNKKILTEMISLKRDVANIKKQLSFNEKKDKYEILDNNREIYFKEDKSTGWFW